jgi:hypothetical protein
LRRLYFADRGQRRGQMQAIEGHERAQAGQQLFADPRGLLQSGTAEHDPVPDGVDLEAQFEQQREHGGDGLRTIENLARRLGFGVAIVANRQRNAADPEPVDAAFENPPLDAVADLVDGDLQRRGAAIDAQDAHVRQTGDCAGKAGSPIRAQDGMLSQYPSNPDLNGGVRRPTASLSQCPCISRYRRERGCAMLWCAFTTPLEVVNARIPRIGSGHRARGARDPRLGASPLTRRRVSRGAHSRSLSVARRGPPSCHRTPRRR